MLNVTFLASFLDRIPFVEFLELTCFILGRKSGCFCCSAYVDDCINKLEMMSGVVVDLSFYLCRIITYLNSWPSLIFP